MLFQYLADGVEESPEGLRGEEALLKLNAVVDKADKRMGEKIKIISSEVGAKMKVLLATCFTVFQKINLHTVDIFIVTKFLINFGMSDLLRALTGKAMF